MLHTIGTRFALEIILNSSSDRFIDSITSLITRGLEDEGLGGSKSRGFGEVSVQNVKIQEITTELIEKRSESIGRNPRFSVYLVSPMIIEDTYRSIEPPTLLEGARRAYSWCFKEGKPSLPDLVRLKQIFSYEVFGGWSLREGKQRKSAVSISSGSSFLFEYLPSSGHDAIQLLAKGLASLEY
ncbi:MAG TPA: type III-B CRISPR module-associated Cmr3 family protein [Nitrososphaeraceae archaeon]|nr:type III-B CRISPR module-associated Cmr3 family protein [Nitrososphaeraceae archaeon]